MSKRAKNPVKAVEHSLAILEFLRDSEGAGVSEIARHLDLSKSAVHNHLATLRQHDYVVKGDGNYFIGVRWLGFGGYARDRHPLFRNARRAADEVADETGEFSILSTEVGGRNLYLYLVFGGQAVSIDAHLGIEYPLHCTASGKAILASLPGDRVEAIIDEHGLSKFTDNTIVDRDVLFERLEEISNRGVAFDDEEFIEGVRAIAAPIRIEETGEVLGALSVSGPTRRIEGDLFREEYPDLIHRTARMVEIDATYQYRTQMRSPYGLS